MIMQRLLAVALWLMLGAQAFAQAPVLNEVQTIATASTGAPLQLSFAIATPGTYQVTLTDLGAAETPPAPLAWVELAVIFGDAIVGAPLMSAGTLTFTATAAGTYSLHIIGMPGTTPGSGPIGVEVTSSSGGAPIFTASNNIAPPSQATPNAIGVLNDSFTVASSGNYQVTLADLGFPQSLGGVLTLIILESGAASPVVTLSNSSMLQQTVALDAGVTYRIFGIGQLGAGVTGGLYSAVVTPAGAAAGTPPTYFKSVPVGGVTLLGNAVVGASSPQSFAAADLAFPTALTQLGAALVINGALEADLTSAGSLPPFTPPAGTYQVYAIATPSAASPGAGSYAVQLQPSGGGAAELTAAQAVSTPGGNLTAYTFSTSIKTGGSYTAALHDFLFPSPLIAGSLAVVQGTALLGTPINSPGSLDISPAAGTVTLLAFAEAGAGGSLMDINVTSGGTTVFDQPQGVGAAFNAQSFSIPSSGSYTLTAADLSFPAAFTELAVIVTQGSTLVGEIEGGGSFNFQGSSGDYFASVLASPATTGSTTTPGDSGTYSLKVAASGSAPVVNLTASTTSVASGGTVTLNWTTQNATTCTASGGGWTGTFTGSQAASGSATSPAIMTTTAFTLTCQGPGGSTASSVTVKLGAESGRSGGGALDLETLLALGGYLALRARRLRQTRGMQARSCMVR